MVVKMNCVSAQHFLTQCFFVNNVELVRKLLQNRLRYSESRFCNLSGKYSEFPASAENLTFDHYLYLFCVLISMLRTSDIMQTADIPQPFSGM